jgi:flagellar basal-body rod protein FlgC
MGMFSAFDISASGLTANRVWMDVIADNIANAETTHTTEGGPYRRRQVQFSTILGSSSDPSLSQGQGVRVAGITQDQSALRLVYNPGHPDARADGYVEMPNVNAVTEMVDMMVASRAYEANTTAMETSKGMVTRTLDILR